MPSSTERKPLRLTNLGEIVRLHSVSTSLDFWREQVKEAQRVADIGGDWEFMLHERIDGLSRLLNDLQEHGFDWLALAHGTDSDDA